MYSKSTTNAKEIENNGGCQLKLNELEILKGKTGNKKRVGRGIGSGKGGHTSGRGAKGQKARSGGSKPNLGFEGGQVPLYKRMPQLRGFRVHGKVAPVAISLNIFNAFKDGDIVTPRILKEARIIRLLPKLGLKVLSTGELKKKISFKGFKISAAALEKIEKAGAKVLK
jgi:large subunit ribosomal protein L15